MFKTQAKQESFILKMVKIFTSFPVQYIQHVGHFNVIITHKHLTYRCCMHVRYASDYCTEGQDFELPSFSEQQHACF